MGHVYITASTIAGKADPSMLTKIWLRNAFGAALVFLALTAALPQIAFAQGRSINFRNNRAEVVVRFQRPLTAQERGRLTRAGVRFYQALSTDTYLVKIRQQALRSLETHGLLRDMQQLEPGRKLTPSLRGGNAARHALNADGTINLYVRFYEDVRLPQALTLLDRLGIAIQNRNRMLFHNRLIVQATPSQIAALAEHHTVQHVEEVPPPPKENNATAAQVSNVDDIQAAPFNLTGTNVRIGQWDGGPVRATHQDLTPRVTIRENDQAESNHATHVAGTMISSGANNANARGMAPAGGQLFSFDFGDDTTTEQNDAVTNDQIVISNHSWGSVLGWNFNNNMWTDTGNDALFGRYEGTAAAWDALVRATGLIVHKSSGNDSNDCNPADNTDCDGALGADGQRYDTISTHGNAKNIITVGAINDDGITITAFSSTGPANDNRIKPDVVANGAQLTSTCNASDSNYCGMSGTSMSSPTVSGITAVLVERYRQRYAAANPSPDIVKALLVNTATDLGRPGPDYVFGHGLVNALLATQTIDVGPVRILTEAVGNGETDEYVVEVPSGTAALRVTLNWLDPEGAANDDGVNDIINNLDLELVGPDNLTRFPFTGPGGAFTNNATATGPNAIDTVEHALVNAPQQGIWKVRIRGAGVPTGPQNYAVVANASFILPGQPNIKVNAALDFNDVCPGDKEERTVTIFNIGGADLQAHSVSVVAGSTDFSVLPNPSQPFIVKPGAHIDVTVRFDPASPGLKAGTLRIQSNDADQAMLDFPMTGEGGSPDIDTLVANAGNFGNVCLGSFKDLALTISNGGTCPLKITGINSSAAEFQVAGVSSFPLSIGPGDALEVPIRLQPTSLGAKAANLTVNSDDPDTAAKVAAVSGSTAPGDIRVTGSTAFGNVCAGTLAEKEVSVCNVGACNLNVSSAGFAPACSDFTLVNNAFPAVVSPDSCVPLTVRFTPTSDGPKSCYLVINSDDPDSPAVMLTTTATTPEPSIDVGPSHSFLPEVIQSTGACNSSRPFSISNTGTCSLSVTNIAIGGVNGGDFGLSGLPSFPVLLDPGHQVGSGALNTVFMPTELDRDRLGALTVTYVSDPITGATTSVMRDICGEGVRTGVRVLARVAGIPVPIVERIHIQRITGNRNRPNLDTVENVRLLPLQTVTPAAPCAPFQFHREYGTVSNPIQLLPGSYIVTVTLSLGPGGKPSRTVGFDVTTCDFNPTVIVDFDY